MRRATRLAAAAARSGDPGTWFDLLDRAPDFRALQHKVEIVGLMEPLAALRPGRLLEIGSWHGGTAFLFARVAAPDAIIVLIDSGFDTDRRAAVKRLVLPGQRLTCLSGDSHDPATLAEAHRALGGPLDFLFVDGDHSWDAVSADWRDYAPLVRGGGIVAFHDIVADHRTRLGHDTPSAAGDVWRFWAEIKRHYGAAATDLIADPEQDGAGIGVLRWDGARVAPAIDSGR
ncbi:MAG: class I SAM-dependent methyltransferase [Gemmatimonadales bacterium]